ncbi:MAG: ABC transporter permease [Pirellulaceae bacterium]
MPIHDVGYRRWDRTVGSPWLRWTVIAGAGMKLMWKNHWLRRMLFLAWLPAAALGIVIFVYEQGFERQELQSTVPALLEQLPQSKAAIDAFYADPSLARHEVWSLLLLTFFRYPQAVLMVLLVGMIAPPLISQDFRSRAFLLYFSRPIAPAEYIFGKAMVIWVYLAAVTTLPALVLYALGVLLSPSLHVVLYTWDIPLRILVASAVLLIPTSSLALFFSSLTTESRYAGFAWFAVWGLGWAAYANLEALGLGRQWSMISLYHVLGRAQAWVFGLHTNINDVTSAAALLVLITILPLLVLLVRVAAPMRV